MPTLSLVAGDCAIDVNGHHICNENGKAQILSEPMEVEISTQENYDRIAAIIEENRILRGLNADGSVPLQEEIED